MQPMIFASNNLHKIREIQSLMPSNIQVMSLQEAGILIDIPEPHHTLEENAREKSTTIYQITHTDCFSEDTGLEVAALNGAPGVRSARYAGEDNRADKNIEKLLFELTDQTDRSAQFKTVISLIQNGKEIQFTGICKGHIIHETKGDKGFGYDPVFVPEEARQTFAEMTLEEKNRFSHRKKATEQLIQYLTQKHV